MPSCNIDFEPIGRRGQCQDGESILDCARRLRVGISSVCGGVGTCGKCRVKIIDGSVSEPTSSETDELSDKELSGGWRLACQVYPSSDIRLHLPPESMTAPQRMQVEGLETEGVFEPPVKAYQVTLATPSLINQEADAERLLAALSRQHQVKCDELDFSLLKSLSPQIRAWDSQFKASVRGGEVVAISHNSDPHLGFAADLGSTKIAGYIVDMTDGRTLALN